MCEIAVIIAILATVRGQDDAESRIFGRITSMRTPRRATPPGTATASSSPGTRLQQLRTRRGWTQDELASRAEVSKSFLSELENDHALPGGELLLRLADVLGTTTDYLLRGAVMEHEAIAAPVEIPSELASLAQELNLSFQATTALLDARRLVVGRRGKQDIKDWGHAEWKQLYERLREYLR